MISRGNKLSSKYLLLIGPLPPPVGGARLSFRFFFDYLNETQKIPFEYFDLPVWSMRSIGVDHPKTALRLLQVLSKIPNSSSVIIFASRGFCFSYGLIITLIAKSFRKTCYVRLFGGRPIQFINGLPNLARTILLHSLNLADKILIQTEFGASEFPAFMREKISVIPGYRKRHRVVSQF